MSFFGSLRRPRALRLEEILRSADPMRVSDRTPVDDLVMDALAFRAMLAQAPEVMYVMESAECRLMRLSAAAPRVIGMDDVAVSDPALGKSPEELYDPETARILLADLHQLYESGEPMLGVLREILFPNGAVGYGAVSVFPMRDADGNVIGVVGSTRDVTKSRLAPRPESWRFDVAPEQAAESEDHDVRPISQSACERVVELTHAETAALYVLGEDGLKLEASTSHTSNEDSDRALAERALAAGDRASEPPPGGERGVGAVAMVVRKGGEIAGVLVGRSGMQPLDGGDMETIELFALVVSSLLSHASEVVALQRFRAVFEGTSVGIARLKFDGRAIEANPALHHMLGYSTGIPFDRDFHDSIVHPDDRQKASSKFAELVGGAIDGYSLDVRLLRNSPLVDPEAFIWCELQATVERDATGRPTGAILMVENVTERRRAEQRLLQTQKLEAIGQLTAGVAHEFNNLLMGIGGYAELARGRSREEGVLPLLDGIVRSADRAAHLTKQLLAYGRQQPRQSAELNLNKQVGETIAVLTPILGERAPITVDCVDDLWPATVDAGQIEQVLFNLALNARDAMPDGGPIVVATRNVEVPSEATLPVDLPSGRYVSLSVRDEGNGMADDVRLRALEPFFTTKAVGEGTGLGLSSVYGIAKQNRGDVAIDTELGHGTTVTVFLPASEVPAADSELAA